MIENTENGMNGANPLKIDNDLTYSENERRIEDKNAAPPKPAVAHSFCILKSESGKFLQYCIDKVSKTGNMMHDHFSITVKIGILPTFVR